MMNNKKSKSRHYSLKNILSKKARYNVIFGKRSNGKTYAVLDYALREYLKNGSQTALVRRYRDDFTGKTGQTMCANMLQNDDGENIVKLYSNGAWNSIHYHASRWYLERVEVNNKGDRIVIEDETPFMWGFSISAGEHDKSTGYPRIKTIFFDEFISRDFYLKDEFVLWMNTVSTIVRNRDDVKIFMCGNTINKYCPYFREMGLKHILKMKPGDIDIYEYGDSGLRVAVEFSDSPNKKERSDVYFAFDNPKLNMITGKGDVWELDIYPHCPVKFKPKDIVFIFFIKFSGNLLQCEVVENESSLFIFVHEKTTELQHPESDLIFSPEINVLPNWHRRITKPMCEVDQKIYNLFKADKVFYSDNQTGDVVKNYIMWCMQ